MFTLQYEHEIEIQGIPLPWIPKIELYYPDLPQFPIIYINSFVNDTRVVACTVAVSYKINESDCDALFTILSNTPPSTEIKEYLKTLLSERIGFEHKISLDDIVQCCNGNPEYITLFTDVWQYIKESYGEYIPYGRYYDEHYSIVRFVSAWQPKTGRQSEMRMLYNFMSAFGEKAHLPQKWKHLEFYVIPNILEIQNDILTDYPKFHILNSTVNILFSRFFTKEIVIEDTVFNVMERAWKQNKNDFISLITNPMYSNNELSESEKIAAETLVDAFNRHAWRAAYYISSLMNLSTNYANWTKEFFVLFYENGNKLKGYSEKVMACFLQQGFLNQDVIPIDTWIKTFYEYPLGIKDNSEFFNNFSSLGKLERVIWLASQSNKTNMHAFFDVLWCQRYGTTGNRELRGINPISCYSCKLKNTCVGANNTKTAQVYLLDELSAITVETIANTHPEILFVVTTRNKVPVKCYKIINSLPVLIDEFSGYKLNSSNQIDDDLISRKAIIFEELVYQNKELSPD